MKYLKYLSYILLAISAAIVVFFYASGYTDSMVSLALNWAGVLMLACLVGAICLPLFFSTGKGLKGTIIKLGVVLVLCAVSYFAASGDPIQVSTSVEPTGTELKLTDTGLILTTILFAVATLAILLGGLINTIRNR